MRDERDYAHEREQEREREGREGKRKDKGHGRQMIFSQSRSSSWDCKRHAHINSPKRHQNGAKNQKGEEVKER